MKCLAVFHCEPGNTAEPPQEFQRAIVERVFALARREAKFGVIGVDVVEQTVRQAAEAAR